MELIYKKRLFVLKILSIFILSYHLSSATKYHPKLKWKEIPTEHFVVYFHLGEEEHAQYLANLSEKVYEKITSYFKWEPKGKTRIILVDSFDISNGYSTPIPYNLIGIYLLPPPGYSQIGCWDEWLNFVFTHEFVHTIQLDSCGKVGKILRKISGRAPTFLHFPNYYLPIWTIEGLAVMGETIWTRGGRGRAGDFDMILRADMLEGVFPKIDIASTYPDSWPGRVSPYLYGGKFLLYLREKYGDEKIKELFKTLSNNLIPYTSDWDFKGVYGKPFKKLWNEWLKTYKEETEKIERERESIAKIDVLKEIGFELGSLLYSIDGERLFFISINPHEFPKIKSIDLKTRKVEDITDCFYGNKITLSDDGRYIYFDQLDYYQSFLLFSDIYRFDFREKKVSRITKGMRLKEPEFDPKTGKIIAIHYESKRTELVEIDKDGSNLKKIFSEDGLILSSPSISPDRKLIALSANRYGNWDIMILQRNGKISKLLTKDKFRDITPSFSKDGKKLVFSSDRDGFFNLYLYDLEKEKLYQLTNLLTGAFYPTFSNDGKEIYFLEYYQKGYRISKIKLEYGFIKEVEKGEEEKSAYEFEIKKKYKIKNYNPLPTLKPAFWFPSIRDGGKEKQYGIFIMGTDPLERHFYYLDIYHGSRSKNWSGSITYIYDRLYPTLSIDYSLTNDLLTSGDEDFNLKRERISLSAIFPFYRVKEQSFFIAGLRSEKRIYNFEKEREKLVLSGLRLGLLYNSSKKYSFSISPIEGRKLSFLLERDFKALGSDYNIWRFIGEWKEFIKLPLKHHVLGIRFIYGKSWGEKRRVFYLGGYEGNTGFSGFESENFNLLRGYKKESFYGTEALLLNFEYRFPIINIERGIGNFPLFIRRIHLSPFLDLGNVWINSFRSSDLKKGIGMEVRTDFTFSYFLSMTASLGFAKGLDAGGKTTLFLRLSSSF
ncbi:MAG: hypothetical protein ACUVUG_01730 [Candidatus Aminicenantia bacterium]